MHVTMKTTGRTHPDWKRLYELLADLTREQSLEAALGCVMKAIEEVVPCDRGVALMRMDGIIPYCVRWPDYAAPLVDRFNRYFNHHSPVYYSPPLRALPAIDWKRYEQTEYHNEFNRPLRLRHSLGVGIRDETTGELYALFVHRGFTGPAFSPADEAVFAALWQPLSSLLSLICANERRFQSAITAREADPNCSVLSPREAQIADLLCRRRSMREIALQLGISPRTVERHALHIYEKLNVSGKRELLQVFAGRTRCSNRPSPRAGSTPARILPRGRQGTMDV
ncbi:MAG: helix-turn-helix transcriptional regulator [Spirochaetota bacterium]